MTEREYQRFVGLPLSAAKPDAGARRGLPAAGTFGIPVVPHHALAKKNEPRAATVSRAAIFARAAERILRRMFDIVFSAAGLVVLSPFFALIALAIKLDDGGPVLYSHVRIGQALRPFQFLKFRSMIAASATGSPVTAPRDVRITRVGRFLRKYKLDELPQLVNVLRGEMRFVGVRPQLEKHVEIFRAEYEELLQSPPGITDLATLTFRNEERFFHAGSIEEQYVKKIMPVKLQLALKYSRSRTALSDLEVLCRTVLGLGAPSARWRDAKIDPALQSLMQYFSRNSS